LNPQFRQFLSQVALWAASLIALTLIALLLRWCLKFIAV
jgi:hypothetical protein